MNNKAILKESQEWQMWYRGYRKLLETLGPLTAYDIGLVRVWPKLPKRWNISDISPTIPVHLEETPVIPFWHGEPKAQKSPWWRRPLEILGVCA